MIALFTFASTFSLVAECVEHFDWPGNGISNLKPLTATLYSISGRIGLVLSVREVL